eukprot:12700589-Alexandrium_andersonii.AAC.1
MLSVYGRGCGPSRPRGRNALVLCLESADVGDPMILVQSCNRWGSAACSDSTHAKRSCLLHGIGRSRGPHGLGAEL